MQLPIYHVQHSFFRIIIIEKLYIIQHLFLVYYSLLCHFQPALSIGTRLIHNYFMRVCFRTTLMLTYSEHKYVDNVLPGLEIYKYIWCELYTPLLILIAIIILIHSHFSHINVNCSGHTCICSRNETLLNNYRILFHYYMLNLYFPLRCLGVYAYV